MSGKPKTWRDLIDECGGSSAFARLIDVNQPTASMMRARNSVNSKYWPKIVNRAGYSYELLCALRTGNRNGASGKEKIKS